MSSPIIPEHFRYPKNAEVVKNNTRNTCKCLCMHVCACMKESSCFSLWQHDQRRNSYVEEAIMHKREVENFQNYQGAYFPTEGCAKKLVKLQGVVCGLHEECGIQEFQKCLKMTPSVPGSSEFSFSHQRLLVGICSYPHILIPTSQSPNNSPELSFLQANKKERNLHI